MIPHLSMRGLVIYLCLLAAVGVGGCAAAPQPIETRPLPPTTRTPTQVIAPAVVMPPPASVYSLPEVPTPEAKPLAAETPAGHIALLLPLKAPSFQRPAAAVQRGFMAAYGLEAQPKLEVKVYPTTDSPAEVVAAYRTALDSGAVAVVGPLTRNAVTALAQSEIVSVTTLALNSAEAGVPARPLLYFFPLSIEAEARLIARRIAAASKKTIATVTSNSALSRRLQAAFNDEWLKLGGHITAEFNHSNDPTRLATLREQLANSPPAAVFLALDAAQARIVRPYIDPPVAVFATSQVHAEKLGPQRYLDLNGVRFTDMPWLLDPTRIDLARYPREDPGYSMELRRLYAFGMDAARLTHRLLSAPADIQAPLAGASGELTLDAERQFLRTPIEAEFVDGEIALLESAVR